MTNLVAVLSFCLVTNWTTVSKTSPVCNMAGCCVMHYATLNQVGNVTSNTVATFLFDGQPFSVTVKSSPFQINGLTRSEIERPAWSTSLLNAN